MSMRVVKEQVIEFTIGDVKIRVTRKEAERLLERLKKQMAEQTPPKYCKNCGAMVVEE